MKKYIHVAIALALCLVTSCTDKDDVEIIYSHDLTLNISTPSAYEGYGIQDYKDRFLTNSQPYHVGVFTYLYDSNGVCVDSTMSYNKDFSPITQSFKGVKRGKYTVMSIETHVNSDYEYTSDYWRIVNSENLSSLSIVQKSDTVLFFYWDGAVAVTNKVIDLNENRVEQIRPNPIGSLVNVVYMNFDKSSRYNFIGFNTKNVAKGIKLDPAIENSNERYIGDFTESHIWDLRSYLFSNDMPSLYSETIYILEEGRQNWCFGPQNYNVEEQTLSGFIARPNGASYFNFENGNTYFAGISYTGGNEGDDCLTYMGEESDFAEWINNLPDPFYFKEPCTDWGVSTTAVRNFMNGYQSSAVRESSDGKYWYIQFKGKDAESLYQYNFATSISGLNEVYVAFDSKSVKIGTLLDYFTNHENYGKPIDYLGMFYSVSSKDGKTQVIISENENQIVVNYYQPSSTNSSRSMFSQPLYIKPEAFRDNAANNELRKTLTIPFRKEVKRKENLFINR